MSEWAVRLHGRGHGELLYVRTVSRGAPRSALVQQYQHQGQDASAHGVHVHGAEDVANENAQEAPLVVCGLFLGWLQVALIFVYIYSNLVML